MFGKRLSRTLAVVAIATLAFAVTALADTVIITNTIALNTNVTKAPGDTGTGYVRLDVTNGTPVGDANGCNAPSSSPLTVNLQSDNAGVTLNTSSVQIGGCGIDFSFGYAVASSASGTATISVSSYSGGSTSGTRLYETTDTLVITVSAPSDNVAPLITGISINDDDDWTTTTGVTVDISATDNVGITHYRLAESQSNLATATDVPVSPAEASFSRSNLAFSLTGLDAAAKAVWLRVYDAAGNSADASDTIGLDRVAPAVICDLPSPSFVLNQPGAQVSATITDDTSGPLNATEYGSADTSSVGSKTASITGYDVAGNSNSGNCAYTVGYNWSGLFAPVDRPNTLNLSKAGQAIPLKWRLTDFFGDPVTDLTSVMVTTSSLTCISGVTTDDIEGYAAGSSGLQNLGDGYYQFNWKTPTSYANSCKSLNLKFGGAPTLMGVANFQFKK